MTRIKMNKYTSSHKCNSSKLTKLHVFMHSINISVVPIDGRHCPTINEHTRHLSRKGNK
jgi:hypothetical protein